MLAEGSLVAPGDHWTIWAVLAATAAASIVLEQRNSIARKITGPVIAIFAGMALSNLRILPTGLDAPVESYGIVEGYLVPMVIPLLLMRTDILRVIRETGRLFVVFHFSSLGTVLGAIVAVALFNTAVGHLPEIGAAMTASYIGGAINFVAMVDAFRPPKELVAATIVADNAVMALYFLVLIALPGIPLVRRIFPENARNRAFSEGGSAEEYWKPKPISLRDIALSVSFALAISALAMKATAFFSQDSMPTAVRWLLGIKYLNLTTLSIAFPLLFPRLARSLAGSEEIGTFLIYLFFVEVGIPASFASIIHDAPVLLLFCTVMLVGNFLATFVLAKLFGYELEEGILCAVVSAGGPMNGAAIAISKGWTRLVVPSVLAGIWGYIIGNYVGLATGRLLLWLFGGTTGGYTP